MAFRIYARISQRRCNNLYACICPLHSLGVCVCVCVGHYGWQLWVFECVFVRYILYTMCGLKVAYANGV